MYNLKKYSDIAFKRDDEIYDLQNRRFKEHIKYILAKSPYYKEKFDGQDIRHLSLADIAKLPFTSKEDIEEFNDDFCAVEQSDVSDIVMSSGTTGLPTKVVYSEYDLKRLAYNEEKSFISCGISNQDIVLLTCTIDRCFVAGLAYFLGTREIGASTIRNGHGSLESHLQLIYRLKPTVIVGVPTFLRKLARYLNNAGLDAAKSTVKKIICIGEPLKDKDLNQTKVAHELEELWQADAYSTYASSETVTSFCECEAKAGGHLHPDLAIVEIVDEEGAVLKTGEVGEVVVTPLAVEAMPLLRFKTGDISFIIDEPCTCGRNSLRLGPILGRKKQMLKVKGTTVYPPALDNVLANIDGVLEYYLEVESEDDLSDKLTVHMSLGDSSLDQDTVLDILQARLRVKPDLIIEDFSVLRKIVHNPEYRKPVRFIDKRKRK